MLGYSRVSIIRWTFDMDYRIFNMCMWSFGMLTGNLRTTLTDYSHRPFIPPDSVFHSPQPSNDTHTEFLSGILLSWTLKQTKKGQTNLPFLLLKPRLFSAWTGSRPVPWCPPKWKQTETMIGSLCVWWHGQVCGNLSLWGLEQVCSSLCVWHHEQVSSSLCVCDVMNRCVAACDVMNKHRAVCLWGHEQVSGSLGLWHHKCVAVCVCDIMNRCVAVCVCDVMNNCLAVCVT